MHLNSPQKKTKKHSYLASMLRHLCRDAVVPCWVSKPELNDLLATVFSLYWAESGDGQSLLCALLLRCSLEHQAGVGAWRAGHVPKGRANCRSIAFCQLTLGCRRMKVSVLSPVTQKGTALKAWAILILIFILYSIFYKNDFLLCFSAPTVSSRTSSFLPSIYLEWAVHTTHSKIHSL